ncbi:MAG: hypothetical protein AAF802_15840 [Planctomycetota bacterium]
MIGLVAAGVAFAAYAQSPAGQVKLAKVSIATPVFGSLVQKQALSRMALVVSRLPRSGLELVDVLRIAERSATNALLRNAFSAVK